MEEIYNNLEDMPVEANDEDLGRYNWGAFGFGMFWGIFNGAFIKTFIPTIILAALFLMFQKYGFIIYMIYFGFMIYWGRKGNRWAWNNKNWKAFNVFKKIQHRWNIAGVLWFIFSTIAIIILSIALFITKQVKEFADNPESLITKVMVIGIVTDPKTKNAQSGEEIAKILIESMNTNPQTAARGEVWSLYNKNTLAIKKQNPQNGKLEIESLISLYKKGSCNLEAKNCYVSIYYVQNNKIVPIVKTFYNDKGETKSLKLTRQNKRK